MEHSLDVQTRLENLIWTVSGNYDLEISPEELDERLFEKSPYIAFYHAIEKDVLRNILIPKLLTAFLPKRCIRGWSLLSYSALESSVLTAPYGKRRPKNAKEF